MKAPVHPSYTAKKAAEKEKNVSKEWEKGAKDLSKKEQEEEKRLAALAAKLEREALLAAEEASMPSKPKGKKPMPDMSLKLESFGGATEEYSASGIDNALDLMSLATSKTNDQVH